jgi:high affinity choline transporter 7
VGPATKLFDPKANRIGSMAAFSVSLILRVGGGEPLLGIHPWIPYPELFTRHPADWYDPASGAILFPYKTMAAAAGLILLPLVSRLTAIQPGPQIVECLRIRGPT